MLDNLSSLKVDVQLVGHVQTECPSLRFQFGSYYASFSMSIPHKCIFIDMELHSTIPVCASLHEHLS